MSKQRKCRSCGNKIPKARLEILPKTTTCVDCSNVKPYKEEIALGIFPEEDYKTPEVTEVEGEQTEASYEDFKAIKAERKKVM